MVNNVDSHEMTLSVNNDTESVSRARREIFKITSAAAFTAAAAAIVPHNAEAASTGVLLPTPTDPPLSAKLPLPLERSAPHVQISLDIFNGGASKIPDWELYSPAYFVLPAHSLVTMSINDYDDGAQPLLAGMEKYARVYGTVGNVAIYALNQKGGTPDASKGQVIPGAHTAISPKQVAHTFTVPAMNLNVPSPAGQTVTFLFYTGKPGMYQWQCMAPCGVGSAGMGGSMQTLGFMRGYLYVK